MEPPNVFTNVREIGAHYTRTHMREKVKRKSTKETFFLLLL